jgi:signal transduction histidine kinase
MRGPPKRPELTVLTPGSMPPASQSGAHSSIPMSKEIDTSTRHKSIEVARDVASEFLDRLLVATIELPVSNGEEAVVTFMLKAIAEIFPQFGVGACLVLPQAENGRRSGADVTSSSPEKAEQSVHKITPPGEDHRAVGMDPTRLFPGYAFECSLESEPGGTSLHLAGDDAQIEDERSAVRHVLARAAQGMGRGLIFARAHARAKTDAQNLRALNDHMVQAEKLASLGQIAAGVVHELNNPLTSIVAYTDYLLRKSSQNNGDPDDAERLRRIGESATRMLRFTRDLVTYSRPSKQVPVPVQISTVIERALAFCEHVLAEAGVSVERQLDPEPQVFGMPEQLAQVFVNLITNACHAMPPADGKLTIVARYEDGKSSTDARVAIVVEDNGHGIAPEHLSSIFVPFFTTKTEGRGTGLGLSIVKNIIEQHSGDIWAEPATNGIGTRFVIMLRRGAA